VKATFATGESGAFKKRTENTSKTGDDMIVYDRDDSEEFPFPLIDRIQP
jgi:hypothetical protein